MLLISCAAPKVETDWTAAQNQNVAEAYENFLQLHSDSVYAPEAKARLLGLRWLKLRTSSDIDELNQFQKEIEQAATKGNRLDKFAEKVQDRRAVLTWNGLRKTGDLSAVKQFLIDFPKSSIQGEAEQRLQVLKLADIRRRDFDDVCEAGDIDRYVAFLLKYDDLDDSAEVRRRLHAMGRWALGKRLGELALEMGPKQVMAMEFSVTPFTGGGLNGTLSGGDAPHMVTLSPNPYQAAAALMRFRTLLEAGADPSAVRIASTRSGGRGGTVQNSPVPAAKGGMTLLQYFKKHKIKLGIDALQHRGQAARR
jgi:hypothetical protein